MIKEKSEIKMIFQLIKFQLKKIRMKLVLKDTLAVMLTLLDIVALWNYVFKPHAALLAMCSTSICKQQAAMMCVTNNIGCRTPFSIYFGLVMRMSCLLTCDDGL